MSSIFKKLFAKAEPPEISALRQQQDRNIEAIKLSDEICGRAEAARSGLNEAIAALHEKPSMENAMAFTEAHERHSRAGALDEAARICKESAHVQIVERTRPLLQSALQSVMETLEKEMARVASSTKSDGEKLGIEAAGSEHPIHRALLARHKEARSHFGKFENEDSVSYSSFPEIQTSVAWVLAD